MRESYYAIEARGHRIDTSRMVQNATGRAAVLTLGWAQYHPTEAMIEVIDIDGKRRMLTPIQNAVYQAARTLQDRATLTMIAASLGVATSSVSRALLKLSSFGLIAYDVARGRYGGITMVRASVDDLKRRAQSAWERLKAERMRREGRWYDRLARSGYPVPVNVASYMVMDATLKVPDLPWTAQDLLDAGLEPV